MMKAAFYKGTRPGIHALFNIITRTWLRGKYSHCEVIFSDGLSASSSFLDGGVRFKHINYNPDHWDIVDLPNHNESKAREWFIEHSGNRYDILGILGYILRIIGDHPKRWVCSEAIMEALGYEESWRYDPCIMYSTLEHK